MMADGHLSKKFYFQDKLKRLSLRYERGEKEA
jgi:hypothetical protein